MSTNRCRALPRINFIHTGTRVLLLNATPPSAMKKRAKEWNYKGAAWLLSFLWEVVMEGGDVEVNVRMKEILRKPLYSKNKLVDYVFVVIEDYVVFVYQLFLSRISKTVSTLLFEYLSNFPQLLTPPPTLHLTPKQVFWLKHILSSIFFVTRQEAQVKMYIFKDNLQEI